MSETSSTPSVPQSPCAICRSYGHFTHDHPDGYVNPIYDLLEPHEEHDACGCEKCHPEIHMQPLPPDWPSYEC